MQHRVSSWDEVATSSHFSAGPITCARRGSVRKLALALGLFAAVFLPATARASSVTCGDTITTSVTLSQDLVCSGSALFVPTSGVTINLNGFSILGQGSGAGISIGGANDVTVENGTVRGFDIGVDARQFVFGELFEGLRVVRNRVGINLFAVFATVQHTGISENMGTGIEVVSGGLSIFDSLIRRNGGEGIDASDAGLVASRNRVIGNAGFGIFTALRGVTVTNNWVKVSENALTGISVGPFGAEPYLINENVAIRNGGHGIVAPDRSLVFGTFEARGNIARLNAVQPQCVNIVCATS